MKIIHSACLIAIACMASLAHAQTHKYDIWEENYTVQGLLGAVQFENLKFSPDDSVESEEIDLSLLPQFGGAWTTLPKEAGRLQYGLECSFLMGLQFDKINYLQAGGSGGLYVSISSSMWMFDLAGGGYASLFLDQKRNVRIYAGGGPLMVYANYQADKEFDDGSPDEDVGESAFGIGVYARTGIEFRIHEKGMFGLGARGTWSNVDFSDVGGSSELVGTALFATYTAGF